MGLIIRALGLTHGSGEPWPWWIKIKLGLWLVIAVASPILYKRVPEHKRPLAGTILMAAIFTAIALAVYKPALF